MQIKIIFKTIEKSLSNKASLTIFFIGTILFYLINVILSKYSVLISLYQNYGFVFFLKSFFLININFLETLEISGRMSLIVLSVLTGLLFSLIYNRGKIISSGKKKRYGVIGTFGVALGFISAGCSACGLGLISLFGLGGALATLPLKGVEISIIAIVLLMVSIYIISRDMYLCSIPIRKSKK